MKIIIIESPYAGREGNLAQRAVNEAYLEAIKRCILLQGNVPVASHGSHTRALDDRIIEERALGIEADLAFSLMLIKKCEAQVVFGTDLGWSVGMVEAQKRYVELEQPWLTISLGPNWMRGIYRFEISGGHSMERVSRL